MDENTFSSRLQLLTLVQGKLNRMEFDIVHNKPFVGGSDAEHMKQWKRRSAAKLLKTLNDAAKQFGIDPPEIVWDAPSVSVHDDRKTDAETVIELLAEWRTRIRFAVFESGELPKGWEISDSNIPQNPIQNGSDLAGWLNGWLSWIHETNNANGSWANAENNLGDFQREWRNARRAIRAFKIRLSFAVGQATKDVNDAEEKLERLIDELSNVGGKADSKECCAPQFKSNPPTDSEILAFLKSFQRSWKPERNTTAYCKQYAAEKVPNDNGAPRRFRSYVYRYLKIPE